MSPEQPTTGRPGRTVALFVTCLVDVFRPRVATAAVQLLEQAGFVVSVPAQGCCGQPNFNAGDPDGARAMARGAIRALAGTDYVVAPSGSCAAMLRVRYPGLFPEGSEERVTAEELAGRTWELTSFLWEVAGLGAASARFAGKVAYHDACTGLRDLGIHEQPRRLLESVAGLEIRELAGAEVCCGFGGAFCLKYPEVSAAIADRKLAAIQESGADFICGGDLGCLLHLEGRAHRHGSGVEALHVAEVLAGLADDGDGRR